MIPKIKKIRDFGIGIPENPVGISSRAGLYYILGLSVSSNYQLTEPTNRTKHSVNLQLVEYKGLVEYIQLVEYKGFNLKLQLMNKRKKKKLYLARERKKVQTSATHY